MNLNSMPRDIDSSMERTEPAHNATPMPTLAVLRMDVYSFFLKFIVRGKRENLSKGVSLSGSLLLPVGPFT